MQKHRNIANRSVQMKRTADEPKYVSIDGTQF